jgi:hypothetical protein
MIKFLKWIFSLLFKQDVSFCRERKIKEVKVESNVYNVNQTYNITNYNYINYNIHIDESVNNTYYNYYDSEITYNYFEPQNKK